MTVTTTELWRMSATDLAEAIMHCHRQCHQPAAMR
jgi:hypothetical protein